MSFRPYRDLLIHYLRPHTRQLVLLGGLLFAGIGLQLASPQIVRSFIDTARAGGALRTLIVAACLFLGVAVLIQVMLVVETYVAEDLAWKATNALRADLAGHVLGLDMSFHNAHTPGELIERIDGDVSELENFFSRFVLRLLSSAFLLLGVLGLLYREEWRVGVCLTVLSMVSLYVLNRVRAAGTGYFLAARQASAGLFGFLEERLSGLPDIQTSGAQRYIIHRLQVHLRDLFRAARTSFLMGSVLGSVTSGLFAVGWVVVFSLSAYLYRSGSITLGTVYLMVQYTTMLRLPLDQIAREARDLQKAGAGIARVRQLLAMRPASSAGPGSRHSAGLSLPFGPLSVEFDRVSFAYGDSQKAVQDVSFHLPAGQVLGVVGRTGSGKTTLTRLLLGLYAPSIGSIRVGGVDVGRVSADELYRRVAIVTQEVQLFRASARDNICLFDPSIPDARVHEVLEELGLIGWLRSLPDALDSQLSSGGGLSAGEAQLLAFARVFLRDPTIVILDEASSRLDPATERLIEHAVDRLLAGRTGIVVAHRLSTVQRADDILVVEGGTIVEHGPREHLARDPRARFHQLLFAGTDTVAGRPV